MSTTDPLPFPFREGIALYCTGKGRRPHQRRILYQVWDAGGQLHLAKRHYARGATKRGPGPRIYDPIYFGMLNATNKNGNRMTFAKNLECKACGRKAPFSGENFALLRAAGIDATDISVMENTIRILKHLASQ